MSNLYARLTRSFFLLVLWSSWATNPTLQAAEIFVLHEPLYPTASQAVTYNVTAKDFAGLSSIVVLEKQERLKVCTNGQHGCTDLISDWTQIGSCPSLGAVPSAVCSVSAVSGYSANSFVSYRARAIDASGAATEDGAIAFAIDPYPWPDDPIPIYIRGNPASKIDLVFIPDEDYRQNNTAFLNDVAALVRESLFSDKPFAATIRDHRDMWNLYITYHQGDAEPGCSRTPPTNWTIMSATVDSGFIVHQNDFADCSGIGPGTTFSSERIASTEPRYYLVPIHELGHSVFSLADEYQGGGLFVSTLPEHNLFADHQSCARNAMNHNWPVGSCKRIQQTNFWRSDGARDLMEDTSSLNNTPGPSDTARSMWLYQRCGAGNC